MGRNIVITPNRSSTGSTQQPNIAFSGLSAGTISLLVEDDGSLVYDGTYGSLFSISDNKDGLLHSVNDVSGLPILQVWDDNRVILGSFNNPALTVSASTTFIGPTGSTTSKLHISGGTLTYKDGNQAAYKILTSDANGIATWQTISSAFTGGTLTGATNFTNGLTANTISATTYYNLPLDIYVTGGTYDAGTITMTNNSGTSFTVTGFSTSNATEFTGGTVTGDTIFTAGLTANTISATTYYNLPLDVYVTGSTYGDNTFTFTNNTGGTFNVLFNTVTGLTVSGDIIVTGGTQSLFSGSSSIEMVRIVQDGSGDAFVVQDQANTDPSHFVINASGNTAIGLTQPLAGDKLTVSGNTTIYGNFVANTISATTYYNLPITTDIRVTGSTYSNNTFTYTNNTGGTFNVLFNTVTGLTSTGTISSSILSATTYQNLPLDITITGATYSNNTFTYRNNTGGTFNVLFNTLTGLTVNGNLTVTGNTSVRALTGTSATISGSGQNILTVIGSGTTSPIFTVQGSSGELFSITDSLTGSLFSVNDISGLPILEVFSDNTTLMGSYLAPSLNTTTRVTLTAGTNTVYSIPTSAYTGAFFDYTVISSGSTGARAGNIMAIWSGTSAQYSETSTNDIGNTAGITFSVAVSGNNAVLSSSATTGGWTLKTIIRSI
jgi:hypothetical protein